jgi:glycerophosphoryl diester phosphodiesterase
MLGSPARPLIIAHRGASAVAPENTLEAFELAFKQNAQGIELDAKLSLDGEVVVIHDPTVDRTTDGHGRVASMSLKQLKALNAENSKDPSYGHCKIPTLAEVFDAFGRRGIINVELTNYAHSWDSLVEKVCSLITRHGLQDWILLSSFLGRNLNAAARLLPSVPRGLLALPGWLGIWPRSFGFMLGNYHSLNTNLLDVDQQQVQRVHRLDRLVFVWTVNSSEDMLRLKEWGVDGIITDHPELAARTFGRLN